MRDLETIIKEIQELIKKVGGVAEPGTVLFDLIVTPVSTIAYSLESKVESLRSIWELDPAEFTDEQADALASLFGIVREPAHPSHVLVTFWSYSEPENLVIPEGTLVATPPPMIMFSTQRELTTNDFALNPTTGLYEASVEAVCTTSGPVGNVNAFEINSIVNQIPNISVVNRVAAFGGTDVETTESLLRRLREFLREKPGTLDFIIRKIREAVPSLIDITFEAGETLREDSYGTIDLYVLSADTREYTQSVSFNEGNTVPVNLEMSPALVKDESDIFGVTPGASVIDVQVPSVDVYGSAKGKTSITLSKDEGAGITTAKFSYRYDNAVVEAQKVVDSLNHLGYDILVRRAFPVKISVILSVDTNITSVTERGALASTIKDVVRDTLAKGRLGGTFWFSDIIAAVEGVPGVLGVSVDSVSASVEPQDYALHRPKDIIDEAKKKIVLLDREYVEEVETTVEWVS